MLIQTGWIIFELFIEEISRLVPIIFLGLFSNIPNLCAYGLGNMLILIVIQAFSFGFANGLSSLISSAHLDQQYYS